MSTVQSTYMPVRGVGQNYLALDAPSTLEKRAFCGVLEVQGVNYVLKSEDEQHLLNDVFQVTLSSLSYPIQVIMRIQPFDVDTYLTHFEPSQEDTWSALAAGYSAFIRSLSEKRTLMQRHFYVVVPAGQSINEDGAASYAQQFFNSIWHSRKAVREELGQAYQRLELRCQELTRQLSAMGLTVRRLEQRDLIDLEYSMMTPQRAHLAPLPQDWLDGIEHPVVSHTEPARSLPVSFNEQKEQETQHTQTTHTQIKKKQRLWKRRATRKYSMNEDALLWPELADLLSPAGIQLTPSMLFVDSEWVQVLDVFTLPRRVSPGWFNRLAAIDIPVDICFYYQPLPAGSTMRKLQRKRFEVSSSNELHAESGKHQPTTRIAQLDIEDLMNRIAAGQERLLEFSMRLVVRGNTKRDVSDKVAHIRSYLQGMLLGSRPLLFEQDRAFRSCLPHCRNELRGSHVPLASHEASSTFPFLSDNLLLDRGILEGITLQGNEPIIFDWWSRENRNGNRLIVAPSGSGKSFKAKLDTLRSHLWYGQRHRYHDGKPRYQTLIVDIEREYKRLTHYLDGQWVRIAPGTNHYLNPFDLPYQEQQQYETEEFREDILAEKIAHLQSLLEIMLAEHNEQGAGKLSNAEKGLLDQALFTTYARKGITRDPATHDQTPPILADLYKVLSGDYKTEDTTGLGHRLHRYVQGSLAGFFGGQTNVSLADKPVVCFDIHDVPKELRPICLFLISGYVWNLSFGSNIPRQFVVDELLTLYQYEEGKHFLESLFQRARKHYLSVVGITQYPKILLDSTIPSNCATTIVMAQELASLPLVSEVFHLSDTEIQMVRSFGKGEALLLTNDKRFTVRFEASDSEYRYCTSDPADLAQHQEHPVAMAG